MNYWEILKERREWVAKWVSKENLWLTSSISLTQKGRYLSSIWWDWIIKYKASRYVRRRSEIKIILPILIICIFASLARAQSDRMFSSSPNSRMFSSASESRMFAPLSGFGTTPRPFGIYPPGTTFGSPQYEAFPPVLIIVPSYSPYYGNNYDYIYAAPFYAGGYYSKGIYGEGYAP